MPTLYIADAERDVGMKNLSRKEAAKVLEDMKVKIEIPKAAVTQWKRNAALDMAIEALKYSEVPNSSDCISRQAVINTVRTIILGFFSDEDGAMTDTEKKLLRVNKSVCNGVRELPSAQQDCTECEEYDHERHYCPKFCDVIRKTADELQVEASCKLPERKTGRWIHDGYAFKGGIDWMHCSECGHKDSWSAATRTPFCAWCGAKMEDTNESD